MKGFNENQQEKGTSLIKSMPQSAQNDTYLGNNFCRNTKKSIKNVSFLRKPRVFKVIAAGGLALIMGIGTLCGVLIAPMGATASSNSANLAGAAQLGDSAVSASPLGLDPKNDPVVFTTDYGLEIKYANALTNTAMSGYTYFTMGEYEGYPVNWVIIGYDSSMADFVGDFSGETGPSANPVQGENNQNSTIDDTPAGIAIKKEMFAISSEAVENDEIGDGCVLVIAEQIIIFNKVMNSTNSSNYQGSSFQSYHEDLYNSDLGLTDTQKKFIVPQTLKNIYYNTSSTSYNQYIFP
ncbi:MAG: hypothetical protein ACLRFR_01755, partial [Clostridia bacterium]